jgi:hypothetical protein
VVYGQALKFMDKEVFGITKDQLVIRGKLTAVNKDGYAIIVVKNARPVREYKTHIKYLFPNK